jgi:hypothetical protein
MQDPDFSSHSPVVTEADTIMSPEIGAKFKPSDPWYLLNYRNNGS